MTPLSVEMWLYCVSWHLASHLFICVESNEKQFCLCCWTDLCCYSLHLSLLLQCVVVSGALRSCSVQSSRVHTPSCNHLHCFLRHLQQPLLHAGRTRFLGVFKWAPEGWTAYISLLLLLHPGERTTSHVHTADSMAHGKVTITVDEYSSNPTQAFTHYNINQSRFQPPHVHM